MGYSFLLGRCLRPLVVLLALGELDASLALACGNAVELSRDKATQLAVASEQALAAGDATKAMSLLSKMSTDRGIREWEQSGYGLETDWPSVNVSQDKKGVVERRLNRSFAVALLRLRPHKALDAYAIFDSLLKGSPDDPYLLVRQTECAVAFKSISAKVLAEMDKEIKKLKQDHAELAVRAKAFREQELPNETGTKRELPSEIGIPMGEIDEYLPQLTAARLRAVAAVQKANQAQKTLETLAAADLLVDAEGYALLSRLRQRAHDTAGAQAALARCQTMANGVAQRCAQAVDSQIPALRL